MKPFSSIFIMSEILCNGHATVVCFKRKKKKEIFSELTVVFPTPIEVNDFS
jgi:hypothetical protein